MTLNFKQVVLGTAATLVAQQVPAQGSNFILTNADASNVAYIGLGTRVTAANGAPIPPYGIVGMMNVVGTVPVYGVCGTAVTSVAIGVFYGDLQ